MKRGRPVEGSKLVEHMLGSEVAKKKLCAVLQSVSGENDVRQICERLGIGKTAFYKLRDKLLQAALEEGEPKQSGRPRKELSPEEAEIERLKAEVERLRLDLEVAYVREEIMLAMPQLFEPLKKKRFDKHREFFRQQAKKGRRSGSAASGGTGPDRGGEGSEG